MDMARVCNHLHGCHASVHAISEGNFGLEESCHHHMHDLGDALSFESHWSDCRSFLVSESVGSCNLLHPIAYRLVLTALGVWKNALRFIYFGVSIAFSIDTKFHCLSDCFPHLPSQTT